MCANSKLLFVLCAVSTTAYAQVGPFPSGGVGMTGTNTQLVAIPTGSTPTLSNLVVDTNSAGGDLVDINVGDPAVVISLITPGGTAINASNAAGLGFTFSITTYDDTSSSDIPNPMTAVGTHTVIQFPAGQPSGKYQIEADASSAAADTGMIVQYYSSSAVLTGAMTDSSDYRLGDLVVTSVLLFDGATPVQAATVTATTATLIPVQASVGSYQLVSQQALSSTMTLYTYSAQLTNSGPAATAISAEVSSSDRNTRVIDSTVMFGDVAASGTATSLNTFSIQLPNTYTFNPSVLSWQVNTPSAPISFTLTDSGTYDAATGDGIYTGTFTPAVTGNYLVYITATGNSSSGVPFSRTTTTSLQVSNPLARLGTFSDAPSYDANGLISAVNITAGVNVQVAGSYRLSLDLQASNGNTTQASVSAQLNTGSQQVVLSFSSPSLLLLGSNGPYTEAHARLLYLSGSDTTLADYVDNAGSTQSYTQTSISPGPLATTGSYSATGVVTGGGPTFDQLLVTIGTYSVSGGACDWSGDLTDSSGNIIDTNSSSGTLPAGSSSVTLTLNGNRIANAGNGPYIVKDFALHCGTNEAVAVTLFQTQSFTASQFTYAASDFSLAVQSSPSPAAPGFAFSFRLYATAIGPFSGSIPLTVSGLPSGAAATFTVPTLMGFGPSYMTVTTSTSTPPGLYTLTVTGISGTLSHSVSMMLVVTDPLRFIPVTPCRVADTRLANGPFGGPIISGQISRDFAIPNGPCGIPASAQAYSLNVAVVPGSGLSYLTVWPSGQPQPSVATLTSNDGRVRSNAAIIPAGTNGAISVFASNDTHVILDIKGYFVPASNTAALAFYPLTPCRVADTRLANGPLGAPYMPGGQSRDFPLLSGSCNIPATAQAYSLNFAAVPRASLGYLTAWPSGQTQPGVASLNAPTGTVTANAAIVPAGANGAISIFVSGDTDLIIDINGYFAPAASGGLSLYNLTPCRALDTRILPGAQPFSGTLPVNVTASGCSVPAAAQAFVLNATVVPSGALGWLTLWSAGQPQPGTSTLNAYDAAVTSNMAIAPTTNGSIDAYASNPTYLVLDIFAYFAP